MDESLFRIIQNVFNQISPGISPAYDRDQIAQVMQEIIQKDEFLLSCYTSIVNRGTYTGEDFPQQMLLLGYALGLRYGWLISQVITSEFERQLKERNANNEDKQD